MLEFWFYANGVNLRLQSWVPISLPMNLRLHSYEFKSLFPCQWISDCIPMSPYSPANESQDSECIPMSSYPLPMNLKTAFHEFLFDAKFLESFGWVPSMSYHPASGMPVGFHRMRPERDFGSTPYQYTWIPLKSIWERFRRLLRDFCF